MDNIKRITVSARSRNKTTRIEAPGCIIKIMTDLERPDGRSCTRVDVTHDGDRYAGEPAWWSRTETGRTGVSVFVDQDAAR